MFFWEGIKIIMNTSDEKMIVSLDNVSMHFNMSGEKLDSLKEYFIKLLKRQLFFKKYVALENISFKICKGDVFGIVGLNGSGKSTTLKIISGILKSSSAMS